MCVFNIVNGRVSLLRLIEEIMVDCHFGHNVIGPAWVIVSIKDGGMNDNFFLARITNSKCLIVVPQN
jgi:hypothetical protein